MMQYLLVFLLFTSLTNCQDADDNDSSEHGVGEGTLKTNCTCGWANKSPKRIIGGEEAGRNEWPMMAGIIAKQLRDMKNAFYCGASIITTRHIVTAGHCIHHDNGIPFKAEEIGIILAAHNLTQIDYDDPKVLITPEQLIKYPKYVWPTAYDIAIIIMPKIEFSQIIGPVCLPTGRFQVANRILKVVGWGYITPRGPGSDVLKKTRLIGHPHGNCLKVYKDVAGSVFELDESSYQTCTSQPDTSQCRGDSGGPIMWVDPEINRYVLVAAPSFATYECHKLPQVNTDITYFIPWIQQVIAETYPEERTCSKVS
uniref:Venom S1 protease 10 n=1 Tax=Oncocephalus sp. TaxID=2944721 RepID=A0AB38ZEJ7_9HEMI